MPETPAESRYLADRIWWNMWPDASLDHYFAFIGGALQAQKQANEAEQEARLWFEMELQGRPGLYPEG